MPHTVCATPSDVPVQVQVQNSAQIVNDLTGARLRPGYFEESRFLAG